MSDGYRAPAPRGECRVPYEAQRGLTTASAMEVEAVGVHVALRGQEHPPPGERPAPLCEVAGPQGGLVATAVPCGGVPSLAPVVMVQEAAHDDATVAFLLAQALVAEQEAEEKAREAKELERIQEELAKRERVLLDPTSHLSSTPPFAGRCTSSEAWLRGRGEGRGRRGGAGGGRGQR